MHRLQSQHHDLSYGVSGIFFSTEVPFTRTSLLQAKFIKDTIALDSAEGKGAEKLITLLAEKLLPKICWKFVSF